MQYPITTSLAKAYGNGFDPVTSKADIHAFFIWWNEKSYFPAETGMPEASSPVHRKAA